MTRTALAVLLLAASFGAACATNPPRARARFEPVGDAKWQRRQDGVLEGNFLGASVLIDLQPEQSCIVVTVLNSTEAPLEFRVGPDGQSPQPVIGEYLQRQVTPPSVTGPDYVPYLCLAPVQILPGWRSVFYLDAPLGREPDLGQYLSFVIEAKDAAGKRERRMLPLVATTMGTTPDRRNG